MLRMREPGARVKLEASSAGVFLLPPPDSFITAPTTSAIRARIIRLERIITAIFAAFSVGLFCGSGWMSDIKSSRDGSHYQVAVDAAQAGHRLDRVLAGTLGDLSRARIQQLLSEGRVTRDGVTIKDANNRVKGGDVFEIFVPPAAEARPRG